MYNAIVVDDEDITRSRLCQHIPWEEVGISSVKAFANGIEALAYCQNNCPDIVLTDVRMPKMDGIALAEGIRAFSKNCKIIFLSGFADKEYLKSAIHLQAITYIEKPVQLPEVIAALKSAVALCHTTHQNTINAEYLRQGLPLLYQQITLAFARNEPIDKIQNKYGNLYDSLSKHNSFIGIYCLLNNALELYQAILSYIYEALYLNDATPSIIAAYNRSGGLYIVICQSKVTQNATDSCLQLLEDFQKIAGKNITLGVGNTINNIAQISQSLTDARAASNNQFFKGIGKMFLYESALTVIPFILTKENCAIFSDILKAPSTEKIEQFFMRFIDEICNDCLYTIDSVRDAFFRLTMIAFQYGEKQNLLAHNNGETQYFWKEINDMLTLYDLCDYLKHIIYLHFQQEQDGNTLKLSEIKQYIIDNCGNNDISLLSIANHIYLSPTYLCAFFKKASGSTINEFLTQVRIEKAKELLLNPRVKVYEVAQYVGFSDYNYFSTLFKKQTGFTPTEYRKNKP